LAGDGGALEFAIGTGRIALPLSRRGVPVQGIDLSPDMVAQLRQKPGSEGTELRERWSDWDRRPFTSKSTKHLSVWEKIAP
jgi:ubiquinone/menaquinone biosynthesis C-methylase UbiE